jgi:hypothetical protein
MALIVEDGTGKVDAESYISVADAITYVTARYGSADAFVTADTAEQERTLRLATQDNDSVYGPRLLSTPNSDTQALLWPLAAFTDIYGREIANTDIPNRLGYAVAEAARRVAAGDELYPDLERGGSVKRERVDVLEVEYLDRASDRTTYQQMDGLMRPFLSGGMGGVKLQRGT